MAQTEVTQAQWKAVIGTNPSFFEGATRPVEQVSWDDSQSFCRSLMIILQHRMKVRLPTEAEWEYAARAGTKTEYYFGDRIQANLVNYGAEATWNGSTKGATRNQTMAAGSLPANPWGLHDVHGNVWEWCLDWFHPYPPNNQTDPQSILVGEMRILRGGFWGDHPANCRVAYRGKAPPGNRTHGVGFRVCFRPD